MTKMPHSAIVMAAGLGERMRPLTLERPKPLLELGGKPLIDFALDHLAEAGIGNVIVNLHYKGEMIREYLVKRTNPPITFQPEETLLDTGGAAKLAVPKLGNDPFFVLNADTVYLNGQTRALTRMADGWRDEAMDVLLMLVAVPRGETPDYAMAADGRLSFRPRQPTPTYGMRAVSMIHPRLFGVAPEGKFSLSELWRHAEARGRLFGLEHDGLCYHLSTPADLTRANEDFRQRQMGALPRATISPAEKLQ
jgi:MurNAc alpha-1-phosphate uridylyltransferase